MKSFDLNEALAELARAHGLSASVEDGYVAVRSPSPLAFVVKVQDGPLQPHQTLIQLSIATIPAVSKKPIWNAFAGLGADRPAAELDAFGKFVIGPFHTLLSAFGNHSCPSDGTDWLEWRGPRGSWRVCDSPLLVQGGDPLEVGYAEFFNQLSDIFIANVAPGVHWCEVFFASLSGQATAATVHLNNELWSEASEALARWHQPQLVGYRSARHFFVALPAVTKAEDRALFEFGGPG